MIFSMAALIIVGSMLWMDREYAFQIQISRPLVISTVLGLISGNLESALLIGMSLEIISLNAPPVGTYLPYDESFCTVVAVPVAYAASGSIGNIPAAGLSLILCMPALIIGREMDARLMRKNEKYTKRLNGDWLKHIDSIMVRIYLSIYIKVLAVSAASVAALSLSAYFVAPVLPDRVLEALSYMPLTAVIIGIAGLFIGKRLRSRYTWLGAFILGVAAAMIYKVI